MGVDAKHWVRGFILDSKTYKDMTAGDYLEHSATVTMVYEKKISSNAAAEVAMEHLYSKRRA